ncbi:hypothetical protein RhiirA4_416535 [Rhizophagus irregularis]|uniref:Uncharacterized protein n=1 Tax=Rhizophagus irregularis TaxID=588596 RepID=A0A2I1G3S2_9GLOM|nr:hypothetical protein RhiirA4_416535 [Rhizophagus irregularis]
MTAFFFFSIPSKTFGLRFFMKRRKASYVRKLEEKSRKQQITTIPPNRSPALLDDHLMEIEILEEPKYQSPVVPPATQIKFNVYIPKGKKRVTYAEITKGSSSDDS